MNKTYLLTPGPTPLPEQVRHALSEQIIHHRTPQFQAILKECSQGLKEVFKTANDVLILASSGTGAMEAAVVNILSKEDTSLCVQAGKFGERWTEICQAYGVKTDVIDVKWGCAVKPADIEARLKTNSAIKAVFVTLCETSTAAAIDLKAIGAIIKNYPAVLVVDAISALGSVNLETDAWNVDMVVVGSQKGLMLPPGLGFISMSPKALKAMETAKLPRYYFDLRQAKKALEKTDTPFTPAVSLVIALKEALKIIKTEGIDNRLQKFSIYAKATREAAKAIGLTVFAQDISDAVTAINVPANIDGEKLVKTMRDTYGVGIAGGQAELKSKVIRIAHMGYITAEDTIAAISCLETVLAQMGYQFEKGKAVKAAKAVLESTK
jgi:aspartate aminotransferase-like enzyme